LCYINCTARPHSSTYCPHPCWPTPGRATPAAPQCRTIWPRHLAADKRSPAAFLRIHTYHTGLLPLSVPADGRRHHSRSPAWQPRHHGRREPSRCGQPADRVGRLPQGPGPAAQSAAGFLQAVFGAPACTLASAAALRPLGSGIPVSPFLSFCGFGRICLTQYSQRLLDTAARPCAGKSAPASVWSRLLSVWSPLSVWSRLLAVWSPTFCVVTCAGMMLRVSGGPGRHACPRPCRRGKRVGPAMPRLLPSRPAPTAPTSQSPFSPQSRLSFFDLLQCSNLRPLCRLAATGRQLRDLHPLGPDDRSPAGEICPIWRICLLLGVHCPLLPQLMPDPLSDPQFPPCIQLTLVFGLKPPLPALSRLLSPSSPPHLPYPAQKRQHRF